MSRTIKIDTTWQRIELTGPWAGFGFQAGHLWTPEDQTLHPQDMVWMSLTCNIAREWRLMMAEARGARARHASKPLQHKACGVINLRDVLMSRKNESPGREAGNAARHRPGTRHAAPLRPGRDQGRSPKGRCPFTP